MTMQSLLKQALTLPPDERVQLADKLWQSIDDDHAELTPAQREDLQKRVQEYRDGKAKLYSWDEVREQLLKKA